MLVRDRMHPAPVTVTPDDALARALQLTRELRIRHLPVVLPSGMLTGVLSDRDIRLAMPSPLTVADDERTEFLERTPVAAVMTRDVVTVSPMETIEDAAKLLCTHRIGCLPVINGAGELQGILTETDILQAFVQVLGVAEPASRIELALPDRPGELAHAIRILGEELRLNIVSILVPSMAAAPRKRAILRLATIDPREAVSALEAAGYEVGWPSLDGDLRGPGAP